MKNLAVAYAVNRRNQKAKCYSKGGQINPKLIESQKMAEGGEIEEIGSDLDSDGLDLDVMADEDELGSDSISQQVLNEKDNPMGISEDESDEMGNPKKSKILSRILGALKLAHMPSRL